MIFLINGRRRGGKSEKKSEAFTFFKTIILILQIFVASSRWSFVFLCNEIFKTTDLQEWNPGQRNFGIVSKFLTKWTEDFVLPSDQFDASPKGASWLRAQKGTHAVTQRSFYLQHLDRNLWPHQRSNFRKKGNSIFLFKLIFESTFLTHSLRQR